MRNFGRLWLAVAACWATDAFAAGFALDVLGGRGTGMAAAMTALVDDSSAIFYNPAGLAQGRRLDLELGNTLIIPSFQFQDPAGVTTHGVHNLVPPPHFYASYGLTDDLTVGLGEFTPFGLVVEWPKSWEGRFNVTHAELDTFYINPEVAYRVTPWLRVGGGVQVVRATAKLVRTLNFVDSEGEVELGAGAWGVGGNGGVQVDALPNLLSFGATYRSRVTVNPAGNAHFSNVPPTLSTLAKDQPGSTSIHMPDLISLGVAYRPLPNLHLAFNIDYLSWQLVQYLVISFQDPSLTTTLPKLWKHTWNYHLGAEYVVDDHWTLRAGILIDPTPGPTTTLTPELPDSDRINIALGAGYRWGHFSVDGGYQLVAFKPVTSSAPEFPGSYGGVANLLSVTLGARY